ncbi:hypothetical protein PWT90_06051 [Aphanocladium album]|nr:hypothetical protein PWT90_06051 [Aphanocladium album]
MASNQRQRSRWMRSEYGKVQTEKRGCLTAVFDKGWAERRALLPTHASVLVLHAPRQQAQRESVANAANLGYFAACASQPWLRKFLLLGILSPGVLVIWPTPSGRRDKRLNENAAICVVFD